MVNIYIENIKELEKNNDFTLLKKEMEQYLENKCIKEKTDVFTKFNLFLFDFLFLDRNIIDNNYFIDLTIVDEKRINEVNLEKRGIDNVTDVLSFPGFEKEEICNLKNIKIDFPEYFGDIMLCMNKVFSGAKEYNHSFLREYTFLLVHSFLHLCGYDHILEEDKVLMRNEEERIMEILEINRG